MRGDSVGGSTVAGLRCQKFPSGIIGSRVEAVSKEAAFNSPSVFANKAPIMMHLLPLRYAVRSIVVLVGIILLLSLYAGWFGGSNFFSSMVVLVRVSSALTLIIIALAFAAWRWTSVGQRVLSPYLGGCWEGEVAFEGKDGKEHRQVTRRTGTRSQHAGLPAADASRHRRRSCCQMRSIPPTRSRSRRSCARALSSRSPTLQAAPLPNVACEMALHVLAYNLTRVMNILGRRQLIAAIRAA